MRPAYYSELHGSACGDGFANLWREIDVHRHGADLYWVLHVTPEQCHPRRGRHWLHFPMIAAFQKAGLVQRVLYAGDLRREGEETATEWVNELVKLCYSDTRVVTPIPKEHWSLHPIDVREEMRSRFAHLTRPGRQYTTVHISSIGFSPDKKMPVDLAVEECLKIGHPVVILGGVYDREECDKTEQAMKAAGLEAVNHIGDSYEQSLSLVYNAAAHVGCESCWGLTASFFGIKVRHFFVERQAYCHNHGNWMREYPNYEAFPLFKEPEPTPVVETQQFYNASDFDALRVATDYSDHSIGSLLQGVALAKSSKLTHTRILEIGFGAGYSAASLVCGLKNGVANNHGKVVSIDLSFPADVYDRFPPSFKSMLSFVSGRSQDEETLRKALAEIGGGWDILFVDGQHEYEHIKRDLELYVPHLTGHGTLLIHDLYDSGVQRAIREFLGSNWEGVDLFGHADLGVFQRKGFRHWESA